jgi:Cu-Zn family superoxide dismutase
LEFRILTCPTGAQPTSVRDLATAAGIAYDDWPTELSGVHRLRAQRQRRLMRSTAGIIALAAAAGCASIASSGWAAVATVEATKGNAAAGTVSFVQKGDKVVVTAHITGLAPGTHGFHIHDKGDCSSGDGMSAGGHFNPLGKPHGNPLLPDHHAGDMPMLVADSNGEANLTAELEVITLGGGAADIIGKSVIVHKDPDDFLTQPTGNSGARVACGVIRNS